MAAREFIVIGAEQWAKLARALRTGSSALQRDIPESIDRATPSLTDKIQSSMPSYMPSRYAGELRGGFRTRSRRRRGRMPGITLEATARNTSGGQRALPALEGGALAHPLFGNRGFWFTQSVKPGFYSEPIVERAPAVKKELSEALEDFASKVARST